MLAGTWDSGVRNKGQLLPKVVISKNICIFLQLLPPALIPSENRTYLVKPARAMGCVTGRSLSFGNRALLWRLVNKLAFDLNRDAISVFQDWSLWRHPWHFGTKMLWNKASWHLCFIEDKQKCEKPIRDCCLLIINITHFYAVSIFGKIS